MQGMFALFSGYGPWNWFFLVVALFVLDAIVPGVHFLWFRLAAVSVGALTFATGIGWQWQLVAFGAFSVIAALWVRRYVQPNVVVSDVPDLNVRGQQYVGRSLVVEEAIECGRGKVRVGDTLWSAEGIDAPAGTTVKVTGARGTVLTVERAAA
jgi:membrane protein implicated in regulation of membrane protease activity